MTDQPGTHMMNHHTKEWVAVGSTAFDALYAEGERLTQTPGQRTSPMSSIIELAYSGMGGLTCNVCSHVRSVSFSADQEGEYMTGHLSISGRQGEARPKTCEHCRAWFDRFGGNRYFRDDRSPKETK